MSMISSSTWKGVALPQPFCSETWYAFPTTSYLYCEQQVLTKDSFLSTISLTSALIKQWANTEEVIQRLNYWICKCTCCFYRKSREHSPNFVYYLHLYSRVFAILHKEWKDIQNPLTFKIQISVQQIFISIFPLHNDSSSYLIFIITYQVKM